MSRKNIVLSMLVFSSLLSTSAGSVESIGSSPAGPEANLIAIKTPESWGGSTKANALQVQRTLDSLGFDLSVVQSFGRTVVVKPANLSTAIKKTTLLGRSVFFEPDAVVRSLASTLIFPEVVRVSKTYVQESASASSASTSSGTYIGEGYNDEGWSRFQSKNYESFESNYNPRILSAIKKYQGVESKAVVAVLDTGFEPFDDFDSSLIADRANFDNLSTFRNTQFSASECLPTYKVGHGNRMLSIISATPNNSIGIAGVAPSAKVIPVKIANDCSGGLSINVASAIRWVSGEDIPGLPKVKVRPSVINISAGSSEPCPFYMQEAIDLAYQSGIVVVASAGNTGGKNGSPANCKRVLAASGINPDGKIGTASSYESDPENVLVPFVMGAVGSIGSTTASVVAGTSASSALVSALIAKAKGLSPSLNFDSALSKINGSSKSIAQFNQDRCGSSCRPAIDALNFLELTSSTTLSPTGVNWKGVTYSPSTPPVTEPRLIQMNAFGFVRFDGMGRLDEPTVQSAGFSSGLTVRRVDDNLLELSNYDSAQARSTSYELNVKGMTSESTLVVSKKLKIFVNSGEIFIRDAALDQGPAPSPASANQEPGLRDTPSAQNGIAAPSAGTQSGSGGGGSLSLMGLLGFLFLMAALKSKSQDQIKVDAGR